MNIDLPTLYFISTPAFLVGLLTGRFVSGPRWLAVNKHLGRLGKFVKGLGILLLAFASLITLGIMGVYLINIPEDADAGNFWVTLLVALWILFNITFEIRDWVRGFPPKSEV